MASSQVQAERESIINSWAALDQVVGGLTDAQLTGLVRDGWSVKDHIAHIASAELFARAGLLGLPPHEPLGVDAETLTSKSDDEINAIGYEQSKDWSVARVRATRSEAHQELLDALDRVTDEDLNKPFAPYGKPWNMTIRDILRGNTSEHYDAHRRWLAEVVAQGKPTE